MPHVPDVNVTSVKLRNCRRVFTDSRTSGQYSSRLNCPYPVKMWWTVAGAVVGGTALVVAAPIALPVLGFGAGGVAAGSTAAAVHGVIGNVVAGSVFACYPTERRSGKPGWNDICWFSSRWSRRRSRCGTSSRIDFYAREITQRLGS